MRAPRTRRIIAAIAVGLGLLGAGGTAAAAATPVAAAPATVYHL